MREGGDARAGGSHADLISRTLRAYLRALTASAMEWTCTVLLDSDTLARRMAVRPIRDSYHDPRYDQR